MVRFEIFCSTRTDSQNLTEKVIGDVICILVDKGCNHATILESSLLDESVSVSGNRELKLFATTFEDSNFFKPIKKNVHDRQMLALFQTAFSRLYRLLFTDSEGLVVHQQTKFS